MESRILLGSVIFIVAVCAIIYGVVGLVKGRIKINGGKYTYGKKVEYVGKESVLPSIFFIALGSLPFIFLIAFFLQSIIEELFPITFLFWTIILFFMAFIFRRKHN